MEKSPADSDTTKATTSEPIPLFLRASYADEGETLTYTKTWKLGTEWKREWEDHEQYGPEFGFLRQLIETRSKPKVELEAPINKLNKMYEGGDQMLFFETPKGQDVYMWMNEPSGVECAIELVFDHFMTSAFGPPVFDAVGKIISILVYAYY